jgi:hypothetical protein
MKHADILAFGPRREISLAVEVRSQSKMPESRVRELRADLLAADALAHAPYLLLASPDVFYLWGPSSSGRPDAPPEFAIEAREALGSYLSEGLRERLPSIDRDSLELLVAGWLQSLAVQRPDEAAAGASWLSRSGLYEAIRGSLVQIESVPV